MAELKTKQHDGDVKAFIESFAETDQRKQDSYALLQLMSDITRYEPKMWGKSMIGFGKYHYKSERSRQQREYS